MKDGWYTAFAPATIANFGSGFDAFAAAICLAGADERGKKGAGSDESTSAAGARATEAGRRASRIGGGPRPADDSRSHPSRPLGDHVSVRRAKTRGVRIVAIEGDEGRLPKRASRNCAAVAASAVLRLHRARLGLDLVLHKGLPLSSGLGSSAASAAAGAWAAALALEDVTGPIAKHDLLETALAGEHIADGSWHGDNVWASLLGGSVIVLSTKPTAIAPIDSPRALRLVVVHPDFALETRRARKALPRSVAMGDATAQAARFGSLVAAWPAGDRRQIGAGLADRIAEPGRARLVPGFEAARRAALRAGAYGMTFAGAGPSVVAVAPEEAEESVGAAIRSAFARAGLGSTVMICGIDRRGARHADRALDLSRAPDARRT